MTEVATVLPMPQAHYHLGSCLDACGISGYFYRKLLADGNYSAPRDGMTRLDVERLFQVASEYANEYAKRRVVGRPILVGPFRPEKLKVCEISRSPKSAKPAKSAPSPAPNHEPEIRRREVAPKALDELTITLLKRLRKGCNPIDLAIELQLDLGEIDRLVKIIRRFDGNATLLASSEVDQLHNLFSRRNIAMGKSPEGIVSAAHELAKLSISSDNFLVLQSLLLSAGHSCDNLERLPDIVEKLLESKP